MSSVERSGKTNNLCDLMFDSTDGEPSELYDRALKVMREAGGVEPARQLLGQASWVATRRWELAHRAPLLAKMIGLGSSGPAIKSEALAARTRYLITGDRLGGPRDAVGPGSWPIMKDESQREVRTEYGGISLHRNASGKGFEMRVAGYTGVKPVIEAMGSMLPLTFTEMQRAEQAISIVAGEIGTVCVRGGMVTESGRMLRGIDSLALLPGPAERLRSEGVVSCYHPSETEAFVGRDLFGLEEDLGGVYFLTAGIDKRIGYLVRLPGSPHIFVDFRGRRGLSRFPESGLIKAFSNRLHASLAEQGLSQKTGWPVEGVIKQTFLSICTIQGLGRHEIRLIG